MTIHSNSKGLTKYRQSLTLALFGYTFFYCFILTTLFPLGKFSYILSAGFTVISAITLIFVSCLVLSIIRNACITKDYAQVPVILIYLTLVLFGYLFWVNKNSTDAAAAIMIMLLLAIPAQDMKMSAFLRIAYMIGCSVVILAFILSLAGIVENNRGNSFGFIYRTDYACHLLFLLLIACFYDNGNMTAAKELGMVVLFLYNLFLVGGKTADICMFLVMFVTFLRHYRNAGGIPFQQANRLLAFIFRVLYIPCVLFECLRSRIISESIEWKGKQLALKFCVFSFVLFAVLMVVLTNIYHYIPYIPLSWLDYFPKLGTVRARLSLGIVGFDIYPIRFFGNDIISRGAGRTEMDMPFYFYLDCSYIKMLLEYGLGLFLVMLALMTALQVRLFRRKQYYRCFLLAIAALDGVMEHHLTDISYNVFPILFLAIPDYNGCKTNASTFVSLSIGIRTSLSRCRPASCEQQNVESVQSTDCNGKTEPGRIIVARRMSQTFSARRLLCIYVFVSILLFIPAFATALSITTCSVDTPDRSTVLLLPGSYMEGYFSESLQNQRLSSATSLLQRQSDALCIVSGGEKDILKEELLENGISEERIYVDSFSETLQEALLYADGLIEDEPLPDRKTVCTFSLEQERVKELARDLNTPVNGLSVPLDGWDYARCYVNEQLQLLQFWLMRWNNSIEALLIGEV